MRVIRGVVRPHDIRIARIDGRKHAARHRKSSIGIKIANLLPDLRASIPAPQKVGRRVANTSMGGARHPIGAERIKIGQELQGPIGMRAARLAKLWRGICRIPVAAIGLLPECIIVEIRSRALVHIEPAIRFPCPRARDEVKREDLIPAVIPVSPTPDIQFLADRVIRPARPGRHDRGKAHVGGGPTLALIIEGRTGAIPVWIGICWLFDAIGPGAGVLIPCPWRHTRPWLGLGNRVQPKEDGQYKKKTLHGFIPSFDLRASSICFCSTRICATKFAIICSLFALNASATASLSSQLGEGCCAMTVAGKSKKQSTHRRIAPPNASCLIAARVPQVDEFALAVAAYHGPIWVKGQAYQPYLAARLHLSPQALEKYAQHLRP